MCGRHQLACGRGQLLLCPPAMVTAFPHAEAGSPLRVDGEDVVYWQVSAHCALLNYTGHPAVVLPYRLDRDGLPIGVQVVGKRWDEARLLAIAIDDAWCERLLSSEMHSRAVTAQLLPHDALLRGHLLAQFGGTPQQCRIDLLTQHQWQHTLVLVCGKS